MWFDEAVIYQIYPLGLCGAPAENDAAVTPRILRLLDWVDHITTTRWTPAWGPTRTWPGCAKPSTTPGCG